jgi:hypothetical protein
MMTARPPEIDTPKALSKPSEILARSLFQDRALLRSHPVDALKSHDLRSQELKF